MAILKDHVKAGKNIRNREALGLSITPQHHFIYLSAVNLALITWIHHFSSTLRSSKHPTPPALLRKNLMQRFAPLHNCKLKKATSDFPGPHKTSFLSFLCPGLINIRDEFLCLQANWGQVLRFASKVSEIQVISILWKEATGIYSLQKMSSQCYPGRIQP